MPALVYLAVAIVTEVIATSALKASEGFSKPIPSLIVILGYSAAFYCLSLTLRTIPVGIAYAIWSGVGVALITLIGWLLFKQALDLAAVIGISLIVIGVVILNVYSKASAH
jgi:small multidrug resistance pump